MFILLLAVSTALLVSFLCSLSEACVLSLSMADIAAIAEKWPATAAVLRRLKDQVHRPIAAILILNNLANIVGAAVSGAVFADLFGNKWLGVFSIGFSLAVIQWSEYLPKTLGVLYNRLLAVLLARPLRAVVWALGPLVNLLEWFNRPFQGRRASGGEPLDMLGEIAVLTRYASGQKLLSREQMEIVIRSIKLSQARVRDVMVGREELKWLSTDMSLADALVESHLHHHTRYVLVRDKTLDDVVGYVNVKDIVSALQTNPSDPTLTGIARPVLMVDAQMRVPDLLKTLTRGYQHIAVVRSGERTVGLVTLEDVIEALVGEIEDEYDVLPAYIYPISEQRFLAGGGATLHALRAQTRLQVPDEPATLHDWLSGRLSAPPRVEQKVACGDCRIIVRKIRRSKVYEAIVEKQTGPAGVRPEPAGAA